MARRQVCVKHDKSIAGCSCGTEVALRYRAIKVIARRASRIAVGAVAKYELIRNVEPPNRPAIYIAPHRSMFDLPAGVRTFDLLGVKPLMVVSRRQLSALGLHNWDWDAVDLLPIDAGASGRSRLLSAGAAAIDADRSVAVMPEGAVRATASDIRSGAAQLATCTGAPIVVLGSAGAEQFWRRGHYSSYMSIRRKPMVVVCSHIVEPDGDVSAAKQLIIDGLRKAEADAKAILAQRNCE